VQHEIPDFILEDLTQSSNPVLRQVKGLDLLARIYESKLWYPVVLRLVTGGKQVSFAGLIGMVQEMVGPVDGVVLDVACGPGTYGRRIASPSRRVYGIDISRGMLEQGTAYARREGVTNMQFSRAQVETLPFRDAAFDAAVCSGSLHLFQDPGRALAEIGRTLKPGAPLAIVTFTAGTAGMFSSVRLLRLARKRGGHVFSVSELEHLLVENGFAQSKSAVYGSLLTCRAQKG
jgi:SAM-dependent methyltransferase